MHRVVCLHDKEKIERIARENVYLHIYSLGDLDDFFWPYTMWYGLETDGRLRAFVTLYLGKALPTVLALGADTAIMAELLGSIVHLLPEQFHAHLSPGLETVLASRYEVRSAGTHRKMGLMDKGRVQDWDSMEIVRLTTGDVEEIERVCEVGYPGHWFDPRMLETNQYFGIREDGELVSVAGIHVYSPTYRVAAIGNVATVPAWRGRGYGRRVTAAVCRSLLQEVEHIGLNVKADNAVGISCYERLGFEIVASYGEFNARRRGLCVES